MDDTKPTIYLDNAATSWPKAPGVIEAIEQSLRESAANPGRGGHRMAVKASRVLFEGRKRLAKLFRVGNPNDIAYALNTTHALNLAIQGLLEPGDHVVTTTLEHNSVRRPIEAMKRRFGIDATFVSSDAQGVLNVKALEAAICAKTKLIVVSHSSNLFGSIAPIGEIGEIARRRGIKLLVDAAQSAGVLPLDVAQMGIDMLAFPGHKGLMGPQGTGGLYIHPNLELEPLMHGGTGSKSEAPEQPRVRPDRYEAGTQNTAGIAGLSEGVQYILKETPDAIREKELQLTFELMEGLQRINGITLLGPEIGVERTAIVSFVVEGVDPSEMAFLLDQQFGIAVRAGFHCTPLGHETAGTYASGAVRASPGYFTKKSEIVSMIDAVGEIVGRLRNGNFA